MTVPFQWVTKTGAASPGWMPDEQYIIKTKTRPFQSIRDLVFLSGYLSFVWKSNGNSWINDFLEFSFDVLHWEKEPKVVVVPVVSLGTMSNTALEDTAVLGWGVDYCLYELEPGPNNTDIIKIKAALAVAGIEGFMNRVTYNIVAMGKIREE